MCKSFLLLESLISTNYLYFLIEIVILLFVANVIMSLLNDMFLLKRQIRLNHNFQQQIFMTGFHRQQLHYFTSWKQLKYMKSSVYEKKNIRFGGFSFSTLCEIKTR